MPDTFISYPTETEDIVSNLQECLSRLGVETWVYSHDKTIGEKAWDEIENKLELSKLTLFVVSPVSSRALGQKREQKLALQRLQRDPTHQVVPIVINDFPFEKVPKTIRSTNGCRLSARNVKSVALSLTRTFFPEKVAGFRSTSWNYPKPGDWLEVANLDAIIAEYCELGDHVYFRRISPMGLFECYYPKIRSLFWFAPANLRRVDYLDENGDLERTKVPKEFQFFTSWEYEEAGREQARLRKTK